MSARGPAWISREAWRSACDIAVRTARIGRPELVRLGARAAAPQEPAPWVPDIRRLRAEAGWRPRSTLDEGLSDTIEWWRTGLAECRGAAGRR